MKVISDFHEPIKNHKLSLALFDINELSLPPFQRDLSENLKKQLEIAIDTLGFLTPIVVVAIPKDNKYYVVDGMHRLEAMRSLGAKEIIAIVADEKLYHHILDLNTEKPPTVKDKAKQTYRLYQELLSTSPDKPEEDFYKYLKDASLITLGFTLEEINPKFPAGFYDGFVGKIDQPLTVPLEKAAEERRKRANHLNQLNEAINDKYIKFQWNNPLMKGDIVRKAVQKVYGARVRSIEDDFHAAIDKVIKACEFLTLEDFS